MNWMYFYLQKLPIYYTLDNILDIIQWILLMQWKEIVTMHMDFYLKYLLLILSYIVWILM